MLEKIKRSEGFSLIELIVVIAIMIILVSMLVPNVVGYLDKANKSVAKDAAQKIYTAALNYIYSEVGKGHEFEPNSEIDVEVLWSSDEQLLKEFGDYETVEIRVDSTGRIINYVYYKDNVGNEAVYPTYLEDKVLNK